MADRGTMNPNGVLYAGMALAARLLKPHVVLMESINSLLKRVAQDSPNISLELLSARVSLKKHVGFTADESAESSKSSDELHATLNTAPTHDVDATTTTTCDIWTTSKHHSSICQRVQPRVTQAKTFKQIRPFALELSQRLLPLMRDVSRVVQRMDRWICPPALREFESSNTLLVNAADRPFASLSKTQQRRVAAAVFFHREWFHNHGCTPGQLHLLAFCDASVGHRTRGKKSLLTGVVSAYVVGEVYSMQACGMG